MWESFAGGCINQRIHGWRGRIRLSRVSRLCSLGRVRVSSAQVGGTVARRWVAREEAGGVGKSELKAESNGQTMTLAMMNTITSMSSTTVTEHVPGLRKTPQIHNRYPYPPFHRKPTLARRCQRAELAKYPPIEMLDPLSLLSPSMPHHIWRVVIG